MSTLANITFGYTLMYCIWTEMRTCISQVEGVVCALLVFLTISVLYTLFGSDKPPRHEDAVSQDPEPAAEPSAPPAAEPSAPPAPEPSAPPAAEPSAPPAPPVPAVHSTAQDDLDELHAFAGTSDLEGIFVASNYCPCPSSRVNDDAPSQYGYVSQHEPCEGNDAPPSYESFFP